MSVTQAPPDRSTDDLISTILAAETPLWVRLVKECKETLTSEDTDTESEPDPFKEL